MGRPEHDDTHVPWHWLSYIIKHVAHPFGAAVKETALGFSVLSTDKIVVSDAIFRKQMVRVAALAVAAIQSIDRKPARAGGSDG